MPRRTAAFAAAALVVLAALGLGLRAPIGRFLSFPTPSIAPVEVGVAGFTDCAELPETLFNAPAQGPDPVMMLSSLDAVQDGATARAHLKGAGGEQDLVIWGRCEQEDQLTLHLEIRPDYGPEEVIEVETVTAQTSALDPDHATGLLLAVVNYLRGDHEEAAGRLAALEQQARTPSEQAELAFLRANSLLFLDQPGRYEKAVAAYDDALSYNYEPLQAQAYNNRGVAGVNWALELGRSGKPGEGPGYEEVLEAAVADLEVAATATDTDVALTAYANLGAAQYWVTEDFDRALTYCELAIGLAPAHPMGYVCRAATRFWMLDEAYCDPPPDTTSARDDLATAQRLDEEMADIYFWRGSLADLQATCDPVAGEQQRHIQDATEDFRTFLDLTSGQPVQLYTDQLMAGDLLPAYLEQD